MGRSSKSVKKGHVSFEWLQSMNDYYFLGNNLIEIDSIFNEIRVKFQQNYNVLYTYSSKRVP